MKPVQMLLAALFFFAGKALAHGGLADLSVFDRTGGTRLQLREDLLAVVSVDGVNVVTGQTADPSQSGYVLSPIPPDKTAG